jgi:antitoxin FitA
MFLCFAHASDDPDPQRAGRAASAAEARAALERKSLSDYLLAEIRDAAARPTIEELRARLARRSPVDPSMEPALAVRAERDRA